MLAFVTGFVFPALFVACTGLGVVALVGTWQRYAGAFARLRSELAACTDTRELQVKLAVHEVREFCPAPRRRSIRRQTVAARPSRGARRAAA